VDADIVFVAHDEEVGNRIPHPQVGYVNFA
jgi:hypothetical protein